MQLEIFDDAGRAMGKAAQVIGELLIRVKGALPHREFSTWLEEKWSRSPRMAQRFMKFARDARQMDCVTPKLLTDHWLEIMVVGGRP
jgi:hypothetical protein